jgi:hypothetical protein
MYHTLLIFIFLKGNFQKPEITKIRHEPSNLLPLSYFLSFLNWPKSLIIQVGSYFFPNKICKCIPTHCTENSVVPTFIYEIKTEEGKKE